MKRFYPGICLVHKTLYPYSNKTGYTLRSYPVLLSITATDSLSSLTRLPPTSFCKTYTRVQDICRVEQILFQL